MERGIEMGRFAGRAATKEEETLGDTLGLSLPTRTHRPREVGITMVMDQGWPAAFVEGILQDFGEYVDIVKFWDPYLRAPLKQLERKVALYRDYGVLVQPGGIWLEIAKRQRRSERELLKLLGEIGFDAIEVSSTTDTRGGMDNELASVAEATEMGFKVLGEVGRKFPDGDETRLAPDTIDIERTVDEFEALLRAGAWKVYWEGHLLRAVMGDEPDLIKARAGTGSQQVLEIARTVGASNIIFEASGLRPRLNRQWLQFWLVRLFGPDVNIGNARLEETANLEAIRMGTHPIFGFGNAGNYALLRGLDSEGHREWWRA